MTVVRWAIIGVGIAGRARACAIAADPESTLVAVHRGRFASTVSAPSTSLHDAIATADAVAICSPTPFHAEHVSAVLDGGRHVVVEYPLAQCRATARNLLARAAAVQQVLHVEHIELLDPAQVLLRRAWARRPPDRVEVRFTRSGPADASASELAWGNVARLHRLVDVAGPVAAIDDIHAAPGRLTAVLRTERGTRARLDFGQGPGLPRRTQLTVVGSDTWNLEGSEVTRDGTRVPLPSGPGLFALDHAVAMNRIRRRGEAYLDDARLLHVLEVADRLSTGACGPMPSSVP